MDEGCVFLIVAVVIIVLAVKYWYVSVPIAVVAAIAYFAYREKVNNDKLRAAEQARRDAERARLEEHARQQRELRGNLEELGRQSLVLFTSMPKTLVSAEQYLSRAEAEFQEHAFAPFWDAIENTVNTLGQFHSEAGQLRQLAEKYVEVVKAYEAAPPPFPLETTSITALRVSSGTTDRMQSVVRRAQRDFQFASIYEQRKTNQILVAGFGSLAQALEDMAYRITGAITTLANSVDALSATVAESIGDLHSEVARAAERSDRYHEQIIEIASDSAERQRAAVEMLDNIQRRRKPS
jgi:hypothetical protein